MRTVHLLSLVAALSLAACSSDGIGNDPGGGSGTLLVNASADFEEGAAHFRVRVQRAGQDVANAGVTMESELGEVILTYDGGGEYRGTQAGWAPGYRLLVAVGEQDSLSGSIEAPEAHTLVTPDPQIAFDPHLAEGGIILVSWDGAAAMTARVRVKDFDWGPFPDEGEVEVPATFFQEDQQEIEIRRQNQVSLAGGVPGSTLSSEFETKTRVTVINSF